MLYRVKHGEAKERKCNKIGENGFVHSRTRLQLAITGR
jgi:hypothetical protein